MINPTIKKIGVVISATVLLMFIAGGLALSYILFWPVFLSAKIQADWKIKWGTPLSKIAEDLQTAGIVSSAGNFKFAVRLLGKKNNLRAGKFRLTKGSSNYRVIKFLSEGPQSFIKVTIPEGVTAAKIAGICRTELEIDSTRFMSLVSDTAFIKRFGMKTVSLEGYLYPETYYFTYGVNEEQVLSKLLHQFKTLVSDSLERRAFAMGYSLSEIVTLASIIEGEAMIDSEMVFISSVYHNRLRLGMLLQADPTVQYILPNGPRRLLSRDLEIDSPYNTYLYAGLPPGPISNPGIKAIRASLYPAPTDYLFFVANGKGGHAFSARLSQHLRAKGKFDQIRRQVTREKRKGASGQKQK